ncbi:ROK family protein [Luteimonas arsenica]|uniref:ROK family protein n=1 Tax=Luteimonas arsenica TaxID=1586242 RepID=UPI001056691B|nr:ROK family protein [Luteimonas arsenica]
MAQGGVLREGGTRRRAGHATRRAHATGPRDPFGSTPTTGLGKREIDMVLLGGDPDAAHVVHLAVAAHARTRGIDLAPFVGIACPGEVDTRGHLRCGAQNLPGDWEAEDFFPAQALRAWLSPVKGRVPRVLLHNDAVVQGLSERPRMRAARRWGVLTIGTGLGNASYSNPG